MASGYSNLKIELIGTGDQDGTWGFTTNTNLGTAIDDAISGNATIVYSNSSVTLTLTNSNASQTARNLRLVLTGVATTPLNLIVPSFKKFYIIDNKLTSDITVKTAAGTGTVVAAGTSNLVYNDSIDVYPALTGLVAAKLFSATLYTPTISSPNISSGTLVSPTLVTPALGTPTSGTLTNCTALPASSITGTLAINKGGTNTTATPTQGGIAFGTGSAVAYSAAGTAGQVLVSNGVGTPTWNNLVVFVTGMIMMWSGSIATIPSGWVICDGLNGTPDLRNRFVVGAGGTYATAATGGSANAVVVSHTHTVTQTPHTHTALGGGSLTSGSAAVQGGGGGTLNINGATANISIDTAGVSGTNANLPPYYALAYIMKA